MVVGDWVEKGGIIRKMEVTSRLGPKRLTPRDARCCTVVEDQHSGRGAVWLARLNGVQEVAGSNPVAPT